MENYKFSIPIKINFLADENSISINTVDDLEDIQEKYDVDLEYIIDEYEYKTDSENGVDEEEYFGISSEDIFNDIINDYWDDIIKKLNKDYKLDDLNDEHLTTVFDLIKENFNKHFKIDNNLSEDFNILSVELLPFNKIKSEFYINVIIDKKLKKDDIEKVRNWLDYEMTENWGEKLSKNDISDKLDLEDMYIYVIPWSSKKDIKYIK